MCVVNIVGAQCNNPHGKHSQRPQKWGTPHYADANCSRIGIKPPIRYLLYSRPVRDIVHELYPPRLNVCKHDDVVRMVMVNNSKRTVTDTCQVEHISIIVSVSHL